jgi:hypothetical protein
MINENTAKKQHRCAPFFLACFLMVAVSAHAQPYFFINNDPANFEYYTPGETITALFTIYDDGTMSSTRTYVKATQEIMVDLQPGITGTDQYPPNIKVYQIYVNIPSDFSRTDSIYVLEVSSLKYGTHTAEFKLKSAPAAVDESTGLAKTIFYPNPAREIVTVISPLFVSATKVRVVSVDGKIVRDMSPHVVEPGKMTFDVSSVPTGEYFIQLGGPLGNATEKIVIR